MYDQNFKRVQRSSLDFKIIVDVDIFDLNSFERSHLIRRIFHILVFKNYSFQVLNREH